MFKQFANGRAVSVEAVEQNFRINGETFNNTVFVWVVLSNGKVVATGSELEEAKAVKAVERALVAHGGGNRVVFATKGGR